MVAVRLTFALSIEQLKDRVADTAAAAVDRSEVTREQAASLAAVNFARGKLFKTDPTAVRCFKCDRPLLVLLRLKTKNGTGQPAVRCLPDHIDHQETTMRTTFIVATVLALAMAPVGLAAKPGQGNGNNGSPHDSGRDNGHGNPHNADSDDNHGCPPGLANREPACVPPGLARQGLDTEDWIGPMTTRYNVGDFLDLGDFVTVIDLGDLGLPDLNPGEQYAVIDGTLIRLDSHSYEILQLIRAAASILP
jgi:hypothetical protein